MCRSFPISGSDFVEMFVGVGRERVRDLFEQGRRTRRALFSSMKLSACWAASRRRGWAGGH